MFTLEFASLPAFLSSSHLFRFSFIFPLLFPYFPSFVSNLFEQKWRIRMGPEGHVAVFVSFPSSYTLSYNLAWRKMTRYIWNVEQKPQSKPS